MFGQEGAKNHWSIGARALLVLVIVTAAILVWQAVQPWLKRPLQQIVLQTNVPLSAQLQLQSQLDGHLVDSFFGADLNFLKQLVEKNAWVHSARVSRVWPNRLMVEAEKQVFVARWGGGGYVNHEGDLIMLEASLDTKLPLLTGPAESPWVMSQLYRQMSWVLAREELQISQFKMAHRGAVELVLNNGLVLVLGRDEVLPRLQRLMKVYHSHIGPKVKDIERVDGRYPHGVSVAWKQTDIRVKIGPLGGVN